MSKNSCSSWATEEETQKIKVIHNKAVDRRFCFCYNDSMKHSVYLIWYTPPKFGGYREVKIVSVLEKKYRRHDCGPEINSDNAIKAGAKYRWLFLEPVVMEFSSIKDMIRECGKYWHDGYLNSKFDEQMAIRRINF